MYQLKLLKAKWSIYFNNVCLTENLLPNYTTIYFITLDKFNRSIDAGRETENKKITDTMKVGS